MSFKEEMMKRILSKVNNDFLKFRFWQARSIAKTIAPWEKTWSCSTFTYMEPRSGRMIPFEVYWRGFLHQMQTKSEWEPCEQLEVHCHSDRMDFHLCPLGSEPHCLLPKLQLHRQPHQQHTSLTVLTVTSWGYQCLPHNLLRHTQAAILNSWAARLVC